METAPLSAADNAVKLDALNGPQAEAVAHVDGPLIVFAGAGSGKTRVITYRIANLVATHGVPPYRILAVTFTNKAAGEMRERLTQILGPTVTRELWIGTFHAVCVRLIRRYHEQIGISPNFVIYDDSDQKALMKRVLAQLKLDEKRIAPAKVLSRISREKQEARGPEDMSVDGYHDEIVKRCFAAYQKRLTDANAVDFSDLLLVVLRFLERENDDHAAQLRGKFSHVLVDEFQDVNLVQYRLVRGFSGDRRNICVVGDDDQSIYRWRGADIRMIRGFTTDYADAKLVKLEQNYRSSQNVVGAALGVIRYATGRTPKELWTANSDGEAVRVVHCANERDEAAFVVDEVKRHIAAGTSPRDMAVFYRVHAQSRVLEEVMRNENVPYQIVGGTKFFDRAEVKDLMSYLRVIVNQQSDVDLLRIINKPARKIGKQTVERLARIAAEEECSLYDAIPALCSSDRIGKAAKRSLRAFEELIGDFTKAARTASPRDLAEDVLTNSGYAGWLQKQDDAEADARLDNLHELLGSIAEYEEEQSYAEEEATLIDYLTRVSLQADADTMEDVPRIPMMTIHAAKGLEFDVVFITGMEEGLFPLRGQEPGQEEELEEERRLAYVAITRARHHLSITHTNTRMIYGQVRYNTPARFLAEIPPKHQEREATRALKDISRNYTLGRGSSDHRTMIRAGRARTGAGGGGGMSRGPAVGRGPSRAPVRGMPPSSRRPAPMAEPRRAAGERYIERDDFVDQESSFDDAGGFDTFNLRVGTRVRHTKFGVGEVVTIGAGSNPSVAVKFPGWGIKRIKLTFLQPA